VGTAASWRQRIIGTERVKDIGRPYAFKSAEKLLDDFYTEVERVLGERGVPLDGVFDEEDGS
jgi:hypothetical protein